MSSLIYDEDSNASDGADSDASSMGDHYSKSFEDLPSNSFINLDLSQPTSLTGSHSDFYHPYRPFTFANLPFSSLPEQVQKFLTATTNLYPNSYPTLDDFFAALLSVRQKRRDKLERTLDGVNRAIVNEMLDSHVRSGDNTTLDDACRKILSGVLQPEWREHLDQYVDEIDALIWLDMTARTDTNRKLEHYMVERRDDVERMVEFALRCLQEMLDRVRMERGAQWVLGEMSKMGYLPNSEYAGAKRRDTIESTDSHLSDAESDVLESEDGQWVSVSQ